MFVPNCISEQWAQQLDLAILFSVVFIVSLQVAIMQFIQMSFSMFLNFFSTHNVKLQFHDCTSYVALSDVNKHVLFMLHLQLTVTHVPSHRAMYVETGLITSSKLLTIMQKFLASIMVWIVHQGQRLNRSNRVETGKRASVRWTGGVPWRHLYLNVHSLHFIWCRINSRFRWSICPVWH